MYSLRGKLRNSSSTTFKNTISPFSSRIDPTVPIKTFSLPYVLAASCAREFVAKMASFAFFPRACFAAMLMCNTFLIYTYM